MPPTPRLTVVVIIVVIIIAQDIPGYQLFSRNKSQIHEKCPELGLRGLVKCASRHSTGDGDVGPDLLVGELNFEWHRTTNSGTEERLEIQRSNKGGFNIYNNYR